MKTQLLFALSLFALSIFSQNIDKQLEDNLQQLVKDESIRRYYRIDSSSIYLYPSVDDKESGKDFIRIEKKSLPFINEAFHGLSREEMLSYFDNDSLPGNKITPLSPKKPSSLKGLRVAIDPGHMAENRKQAKWEKRYMKIKEGGFWSKSYRFYEAQLAYATAYLLKQKLEEEGAIVMISRNKDMNALNTPYSKWYKKEFRQTIETDLADGKLDTAYYKWLKEEAKKKDVYRTYFRSKDFDARVQRINSWKPDLTLIIHYNADGDGKRQAHQRNFSMAFIPGAFAKGELKDKESRMDFLRLLISDDIQESAKLSHQFIIQHQKLLGIEPVSDSIQDHVPYLKNYSVETFYPGVYSRNLIMTRKIKGPLCFGESLLQENIDEAKQLSKKDYCEGDICTSKRVERVAEAYFRAVKGYMEK